MQSHLCPLLGLILAAPGLAQETLAPASVLRGLGSSAKKLARDGWAPEVGELLDYVQILGLADDKLAKLRASCNRELGRVKKRKPNDTHIARDLSRLAERLAKHLGKLDEARADVAEIVLRIDDSNEAAHLALGHERVAGRWLSREGKAIEARRTEIQEAIRKARRMTFHLEVSESDNALLTAIYGRPGIVVRWKSWKFHTCWPAEKARRVVRETLRAVAFAQWSVRGGELKPPRRPAGKWIHFHSMYNYRKALDLLVEQGKISATEAKDAKQFGRHDVRGVGRLLAGRLEARTCSRLVYLFTKLLALPWLSAGQVSWVCLSYLGTAAPGVAWYEESGGKFTTGSGGSVAPGVELVEAERKKYLRLSEAGLRGSRSYLAWLTRHGEAPKLIHAFYDQYGKVDGNDLLEATHVVEYLHEVGMPRQFLLEETTETDLSVPAQRKFVEKGLRQDLPAFEARFARWLLGQEPGLCQRLGGPEATALDPVQRELLDRLNALRKPALQKGRVTEIVHVELDADLCRGALLHAEYLQKNPAQLAAWPDAHEEYPDKPGFTTAGSRAGLNSVIDPGAKGPLEAIDTWMSTFYHRLPLLEPGLLRVGWGIDEHVAVLDCTSLCRPRRYATAVAWPYDGMTRVPTSFTPELPNPVPDADQSQWGYPITLQLGRPPVNRGVDKPYTVVMELYEGTRRAANHVDCYFSSPEKPTNPDLAPKRSFCLIPKTALKPRTGYTVVATFRDNGTELVWTFRTR